MDTDWPDHRISALALAGLAIVVGAIIWWRWRKGAYLIGLEAAFWAFLATNIAAFLMALLGVPRWFAVAVVPLVVLEGFRVNFAHRRQVSLSPPADWLFFAVGFAVIEVVAKLFFAAMSSGPTPVLLVPLLPGLLQVLLSLSACAMLRSSVPPIVVFMVTLIVAAVYKLASGFHYALLALVLVMLIAGILKWAERFNPVTNAPDRVSTPP